MYRTPMVSTCRWAGRRSKSEPRVGECVLVILACVEIAQRAQLRIGGDFLWPHSPRRDRVEQERRPEAIVGEQVLDISQHPAAIHRRERMRKAVNLYDRDVAALRKAQHLPDEA